jgi:hypothetical protein
LGCEAQTVDHRNAGHDNVHVDVDVDVDVHVLVDVVVIDFCPRPRPLGPVVGRPGRKAGKMVQVYVERRKCGTVQSAGPSDLGRRVVQFPRPHGRGGPSALDSVP